MEGRRRFGPVLRLALFVPVAYSVPYIGLLVNLEFPWLNLLTIALLSFFSALWATRARLWRSLMSVGWSSVIEVGVLVSVVIGLTYSQVACGPLEGCVGNDFFGLRPMTVSEWDFVSTMILMVATVFAEEVAYRAYVINEMLRITDAKTLIFLTSSLLIGLKDFLYSYYLTGGLSFYLIPLIGEEVAGGLFIGLCYLYTDRNLLACVALRSCYTYVDKVLRVFSWFSILPLGRAALIAVPAVVAVYSHVGLKRLTVMIRSRYANAPQLNSSLKTGNPP